MDTVFIWLIRAVCSLVLFLLALLLITQEKLMLLKRLLTASAKPKTDPLDRLKKARLTV